MMQWRGRGSTEAPSVHYEKPTLHFTYEMPVAPNYEDTPKGPREILSRWVQRLIKGFQKTRRII